MIQKINIGLYDVLWTAFQVMLKNLYCTSYARFIHDLLFYFLMVELIVIIILIVQTIFRFFQTDEDIARLLLARSGVFALTLVGQFELVQSSNVRLGTWCSSSIG